MGLAPMVTPNQDPVCIGGLVSVQVTLETLLCYRVRNTSGGPISPPMIPRSYNSVCPFSSLVCIMDPSFIKI
jgi:hypothetical protein